MSGKGTNILFLKNLNAQSLEYTPSGGAVQRKHMWARDLLLFKATASE